MPKEKPFVHPEQGKRLKQLLKDHGLTQENLAEIMDKSQQTVSKLCRSAQQLSNDAAWDLAKRFGVNPNWLLCKSDDMLGNPNDYEVDSALRSWDADITVESMIQKVLDDLGYSFVRSGDTRFITDERSEMPLPDRDYYGAYNILDSEQRKLGRCSMNDYDDFTEDIVDYIEFRFQKLLVKAQSNSKGVKQNGKK